MEHRWTVLGGGTMTTEQARGWTNAEPNTLISEESLAIQFSVAICALCLRDHAEDPPEPCLGLPEGDDAEHLWQVFMKAMATRDQVDRWAEGDDLGVSNPQSVAVICLLCGAGAETAPNRCPERTLWT